MTLRHLRRSELGAELVEFAMIVPALLMLIAGIVDFALLFHSYETTTNAAREGARLAVLPGYDANDYATARQRVRDFIRGSGAAGDFTTTVTPLPLQVGGAPRRVEVTVTYTHPFVFVGPLVGLLNGTMSSTVTFSTSSTMRTEIQAAVGP